MHSKLRKACLQKSMLRNKYFKSGRSKLLWERYRRILNQVIKLKAVSMNEYFSKHCNSKTFRKDPSKYWQAIKPYMTDKIKATDQSISLFHENRVVKNPAEVCNIFNEYFIKAASNVGNEDPNRENENIDDILSCYKDDDIINVDAFNFSSVTVKEVHNLLENMDKKKATGYDNIPPKILKVAAGELAFPITNFINLSIEASCFPSNLKKSELSPLFKDKDSLLSENYRSLSILPSISKVFQNVFNQQLYEYFTHIFSDLLSAFRKKYGCQHVLTKSIEDSKSARDIHMHVGLLLLDLSKAFDCLPHRLHICKLHAYGVSRDACSILHSYLSSRFQRVKSSASRSDWVQMTKGVPQGSILGPHVV